MNPSSCSVWRETLASDDADPAVFEAHVAGCEACTQALANVSRLTSRVAALCHEPRASAPKANLSPVLRAQSHRDLIVGGFVLTQFVLIQIGGGAFGSRVGNQGLLFVALVTAAIVGIRWAQRRTLLRAFATETLSGHLKVATRAAERRARWVLAACVAWALFCFGTMPFAFRNPMALTPWLAGPAARLSFMAFWPVAFAVYTFVVTLPRLANLRAELERP
jgi:hypothetical protein